MIAKRLEKGDTIGLISPAGPEDRNKINESVNYLKSLGFNVKIGKHVYDKYGYLSGQDKDRVSDLISMFNDPKVDMILCIRGGYGTMRILPFIDFNVIKNNPKIFAGFSDITTLLNTFASNCNLITFHAPMATSNLHEKHTLNSFLNTLMYGNKPYVISNPKSTPTHCLVKGVSSGKLVGGNLCLIASTLGTPYEIDTTNKILFIEDVGEDPYKIDRMLTHLSLAGKLQCCSGFVLGQFTNCELPHYERSLTLEQVLSDTILSLNKPTISNFMSGHSYPKLTLPIGADVELDCYSGILKVCESVVK